MILFISKNTNTKGHFRIMGAFIDEYLQPKEVQRRTPPSFLPEEMREEYERTEDKFVEKAKAKALEDVNKKIPAEYDVVNLPGVDKNTYSWPHPKGYSSCVWTGKEIISNPDLEDQIKD